MSATNKVGNNTAETINADADDIFLWGEDGADTINGNGLDNTIGGGNDNSTDILKGGGGDDILLIQKGNDTLDGGSGYDIVRLADYDVIDTVIQVGPIQVVTDRNGFEIPTTLTGFPLNKSVISLDLGSNKMTVGSYELIDTSVGFGNFVGSNSAQEISLGSISQNRGVMTVTNVQEWQLSNIDDVFFDDTGSHVIDGRGGNDFIEGHAGADTIIGGTGTDTASYQRSDAAVSIVLNSTLNPTGLQSFGHAEGDRLFEIENVIGSAFGDSIIGSAGANRLEGQSGDDTINGGDGDDQIFGGNGADTLIGLTGFDSLFGGSENDSLTGGTAADVIDGGAGSDTANYTSTSGAVEVFLANTGGFQQRALEHVGSTTATALATVNGVQSIDQLTSIENINGSAFDDRISGNEEINRLEGRNGRDTINGGGNNDVLLGGAGDDTLSGDAGADVLDGGTENDTLSGGIGNDSLRGGAGADALDGGADTDTGEYSEKTQSVIITLNGSTVANVQVNGLVEDTIVNVENLNGGSAGDRFFGDAAANVFNGNGGADFLVGGLGVDTLDGGSSSDTASYFDKTGNVFVALNGANFVQVTVNGVLEDHIRNIENVQGGSGNDILFGDGQINEIIGGIGDDKISGGIGGDTLSGGGNNDSIGGDEGDDVIHGDNGDDVLAGGADNDDIFGDADDDLINGGAGLDDLDGGFGVDTVSYIEKTQSVFVTLDTVAATTVFVGGVAEDTIRGFEGAIGGSADDTFFGNSLDNDFDGQGGDDRFFSDLGADHYNGNAGVDSVFYVTSAEGVNINLLTGAAGLRGSAQGDTFEGIENLSGADIGRDVLIGNNEKNILFGNGGDDTLRGEGNDDIITGGFGADILVGGDGIDTANYFDSELGVNLNLLTGVNTGGDAEGDQLFSFENFDGSQANRDVIVGSNGDNVIRGFGGDDLLRGQLGADTLIGGTGADTLNGAGGVDMASYETSSSGVFVDLRFELQDFGGGDANNDRLLFIENLRGSDHGDLLIGNDRANLIEGGGDNDILDGNTGNDTLTGGQGGDFFEFTQLVWGNDQITDFEDGVDRIVFDLAVADDLTDISISGSGTTTVQISLNGQPGSTITMTAALPLTIDATDIFFGLP